MDHSDERDVPIMTYQQQVRVVDNIPVKRENKKHPENQLTQSDTYNIM